MCNQGLNPNKSSFSDENTCYLKTLRYVLYARKSTTDEGSQVRSLGDQVKHCNILARAKGLNVVATFKESGSAKKPNNRPIFSQILEDIEKNKYDAILSFAPDRLSRNMLEGGLLINLLDDGKLKDLQFPTQTDFRHYVFYFKAFFR